MDTSSPTLSATGASIRSGSASKSGSEEMFGPLTSSTRPAYSGSSGASSMAAFTLDSAGSSICG